MSSLRLVCLAALAAAVVACGGTAASPSQLAITSLGSSAELGSAASPSLAASPSPAVSPSPEPLTKAQQAALYLKAATAANKAVDAASKTYMKSNQGLTAAKRELAALAKATLTFIRAMQQIPFTAEYRSIVNRLLRDHNQLYVRERNAATAQSWAEFTMWANRVVNQAATTTGDANELRLALGLPPVPIN